MTKRAVSVGMTCELSCERCDRIVDRKHMDSKQSTIINFLDDLERQQFYGSVELKFEAGRIVLIRKTETIKPNDYRNNRGNNCEHG
jgi:hypothetical protein